MTEDPRRLPDGHEARPDVRAARGESLGERSDRSRRAALKAAAYLLGYPDQAFWQLLPEVEAYLNDRRDAEPAVAMVRAATAMRALGPRTLATLYVTTFDFSEPTALYLTAHELGDSRRRGSALLALLNMLRAAGFEPIEAELPDYLPLLLEFLASAPADVATDELERRLAAVCAQIHSKLAEDHPYKGIFTALLAILHDAEQVAQEPQFPAREEADTGELPYPLRYD